MAGGGTAFVALQDVGERTGTSVSRITKKRSTVIYAFFKFASRWDAKQVPSTSTCIHAYLGESHGDGCWHCWRQRPPVLLTTRLTARLWTCGRRSPNWICRATPSTHLGHRHHSPFPFESFKSYTTTSTQAHLRTLTKSESGQGTIHKHSR